MGAQRSRIATLVERRSRYVLLVRLPGGDSVTVTQALAQRIQTLPASLRQSLTWDRGTELAAHAAFTVATNVQVYFCDPRSPWQRGSNENTNGLLRQYLPRQTDLSAYSQANLNSIARQLNTRPRKTLNYRTPAEVFSASVAATVWNPPHEGHEQSTSVENQSLLRAFVASWSKAFLSAKTFIRTRT